MNEKDILDLEKSFDVLKVSLNSNDSKGELASNLNNSIDDFLIDCSAIVEEISEKKMSQLGSDDFKKLSKIFDIMWDLYKKCVKNRPEFIDKISEESKAVWTGAREVAHTFYENKIKIDDSRKPFKIAGDSQKLELLEELKTYLTNEERESVVKILEENKNKKIYQPDSNDEVNQWMANDNYSHWLTDV